MPKQILFYMSRDDEEEFLSFLKTTGNTVVLPATSPTSAIIAVDSLPEATQAEATRKFWVQNASINLPLIAEFDEARGVYVINGFQSPVVEFLRSYTLSNFMLPGRLEADMTYFDADKGDLVSKPPDFGRWYETIEGWIRNRYKHLTLMTYAGPGAEKFRHEGGLLY